MITDKVGDLITRIRNAQRVGHEGVRVYSSKFNTAILGVLKREGYIDSYKNLEGTYMTEVKLKYDEGQPCIRKIERVSTPGRRVYAQIREFKPVFNGCGVNVISTSKGVMSDYEAICQKVGGEILFKVF